MSESRHNLAPEAVIARAAVPQRSRREAAHCGAAMAVFLVATAVGFVFWRAWVCDDAFITFRHVANCLAGYGPVFNPGERVQGFTHPLWFLLLIAGAACLDVYAVAVALGLLFTAGTVLALAWLYRDRLGRRLALLAAVAFLLSSRTFVEFQTSGLETSLTSLLLVLLFALTLRHAAGSGPQPIVAVAWLGSLLLFTRPDHLLLSGPLLAWALWKAMRSGWRQRLGAVAALLPALAWYGFAAIYYGTPLPNTAYAKLALPLSTSIPKGITYVVDYAFCEPCHAVLIAAVLVGGAGWLWTHLKADRSRWMPPSLLLLGVCLQLAYVVVIGGDFMRGRFFLPMIVAAAALGGFMLSGLPPLAVVDTHPRLFDALAALALLAAGEASLLDLHPRVVTHDPRTGISDEYAHYAGPWHANRFREPDHRWDGEKVSLRDIGERLKEISEDHGPLTVVYEAIGMASYHAGPKVAFVDPHGLTDAYMARCPAEPASRIGHITHRVPMAYYESRQAIIFKAWRQRGYDQAMLAEARAAAGRVRWPDEAGKVRYQRVQQIISGKVLSWERLKTIPAYALGIGFGDG